MEIVTRRIVTLGVNQSYVNIPEGVTHIGDSAFFKAFQGECRIEHVVFPSTLLEIGEMVFATCSTLLSVDFSKCTELRHIKTQAFFRCQNLRHVDLSNCTSLRILSSSVFGGCEKLVLHVPRQVLYSFHSFMNVRLVALKNYSDKGTDMQTLLLPFSVRSHRISTLLRRENVNVVYAYDWDMYADVFDAIGRLNVLWVESLRRQSAYRRTNQWNPSIILAEAETKNYVLELWNRVQPYAQHMFDVASDIVREGERLVKMPSYQRQPEETKLFKEILETYDIKEPTRAPRYAKKARRLVDLRL